MKALEIFKNASKIYGFRELQLVISKDKLDEAIKELEHLLKEKELLEEYVQFARTHIESYRCKCGALGRVGYLCSNKECTEQ